LLSPAASFERAIISSFAAIGPVLTYGSPVSVKNYYFYYYYYYYRVVEKRRSN